MYLLLVRHRGQGRGREASPCPGAHDRAEHKWDNLLGAQLSFWGRGRMGGRMGVEVGAAHDKANPCRL